MVINSPCLIHKKELAIPGQTTTGKEFSNPLMASSLPKTISTKWKVNAIGHTLMLLLKVNAVRHNLQLLVDVNAVEEKSTESEGFEEIVDFLRANPIKYALTVNPTIYTSCIQQFWATAKSVPTQSNDLLLSGEDSIKLNELMEICTKLSQRVLDLETTKTTQALEIDILKRRVKKLEKKNRSRTHALKRLYKVGLSAKVISSDDEGLGDQEDASKQGRRIDVLDADTEVTLVDETQGRNDEEMFDTGILDGKEVFAEQDVV
ncbi:hypothetical protein Tco_1350043, partial [Tanacetum coccineum]